MSDLDSRVTALEGTTDDLKSRMGVLEGDMAQIKADLSQVATKTDLERSINGILRDALATVPAKQATFWTAAMALIALAALALQVYR